MTGTTQILLPFSLPHAWMIVTFLYINPVPVCSHGQGRGISQLGEHLANFLRDWGELNETALGSVQVKTFILKTLDLLLRVQPCDTLIFPVWAFI